MDEAWRALSHRIRRDILTLVQEQERTAGDIAAAFAITRPAVSQHLTQLKAAGLLEERRDGTRRLYRLQTGALRGLRDFMLGLAPLAEGDARPRAPSVLTREVWLEARPDAAFRLFSDPAQLARWKGELHGRFEELVAPQRLTLAFGWTRETAGTARAQVRLTADGSGTRVVVTHEGPGGVGWDRYLSRLECVARGWDPGPDE